MPNYWLITISEENWAIVKNENIYGAPESQGRSIIDLVKPGDRLIFYVKKSGSRRLGGLVVGVYRVVSTWFREETLLWPDEIREDRVKYPWRVRLEPVKLGAARFEDLVPRLSFIGNKARATVYLVGTPANLRRPIPRGDAETIVTALE